MNDRNKNENLKELNPNKPAQKEGREAENVKRDKAAQTWESPERTEQKGEQKPQRNYKEDEDTNQDM